MGIPIAGITDWWKYLKPDTTQKSWDSWTKPHRATLALVPNLLGITTLFEIGCGAGPNLRLVREFYPDLVLGGSDINQTEVDWAMAHLAGVHVHAMELPHEVSAAWEATLSCYTLSYLPEDQARRQLEQIASKYLILIEPWGRKGYHTDIHIPEEHDVCPRFGHNYWAVTRETGWQLIYRWPIEPVDHLDCLAVFERT